MRSSRREYGDSNKLALQEIAEPRPGPGEIKVKVAAAGLNPIDWKLRSGVMKAFMPIEFPSVNKRNATAEPCAHSGDNAGVAGTDGRHA